MARPVRAVKISLRAARSDSRLCGEALVYIERLERKAKKAEHKISRLKREVSKLEHEVSQLGH